MPTSAQPKPQPRPNKPNIPEELKRLIIGQDAAIEDLAPFLNISMSGLSPEGRPAGVFLLLGPSGVGKTQTVHNLAKIIHGSERNVLRVDCGEYQLEHEVAKLIGAPPGYLGHRETAAALSQQKINATMSDNSPISIILFDEIEKAAPSFDRILLGVLDRGTLKLGDNNSVSFENSLIFMTSNLGSSELNRIASGNTFGLPSDVGKTLRPQKAGLVAARKRFSPEFMGRIDKTVTYKTLTTGDIDKILDVQLADLQRHLHLRLGEVAPVVRLTKGARKFILDNGYSLEYGVRDLKRCIQTSILALVAAHADSCKIGGTMTFGVQGDKIVIVPSKTAKAEGA